MGRNGVYTSRIDTPQERAMKWRQFQAGEFDVAVVTYSVFARNRIRAESVKQWVRQTPALMRLLGLDARNMLDGVKPRGRRRLREKKRKAAISATAIERFVGAEKAKELSEDQRARAAEQLAVQKEAAREAENVKLLGLIEALTDLSRAPSAPSLAKRWSAG